MKKVSIIVPVYNGEATIARCLDSLLAQTYPCLEILVIDDGRIMERGRHEDLLAAKGAYARLWDLYTRAVTWKVSSARKEVLDA